MNFNPMWPKVYFVASTKELFLDFYTFDDSHTQGHFYVI